MFLFNLAVIQGSSIDSNRKRKSDWSNHHGDFNGNTIAEPAAKISNNHQSSKDRRKSQGEFEMF